ncbi:MAG: hypothetical protein K2Y35_01995 [Burkholderiales bacterium]|nr:hypothetical protein [Burkholderiales bacterium]
MKLFIPFLLHDLRVPLALLPPVGSAHHLSTANAVIARAGRSRDPSMRMLQVGSSMPATRIGTTSVSHPASVAP